MTRLLPFGSDQLGVEIAARFALLQSGIEIEFRVDDPQHLTLDSLSPGNFASHDLSRADGLWQTTCFEAFWGAKDDAGYWELNLSAANAQWNLYRFDSYRLPMPAQPSQDFRLKSLARTARTLICQLETDAPIYLLDLQKCLCAVVRTQNQTFYFSEQHSGPKPDFHNRSTWQGLQK